VAAAKTSRANGPASPIAGRELRTQGRRTMTNLLDAGVAALADNGYQATRVDDVVRIAGVSHGTFYLYFSNKEDLFRELAHRCADDVQELAGQLGDVGSDAAGQAELRAWIADFLALYRTHGVVIRAWAEGQVADRKLARLGRESFRQVRDQFTARFEAEGRSERDAELRAAALLSMLERFAYLVTNRDLGWTDGTVLDTLNVVVHRGFFSS
jgi:AcrR family transcriptional regulator